MALTGALAAAAAGPLQDSHGKGYPPIPCSCKLPMGKVTHRSTRSTAPGEGTDQVSRLRAARQEEEGEEEAGRRVRQGESAYQGLWRAARPGRRMKRGSGFSRGRVQIRAVGGPGQGGGDTP